MAKIALFALYHKASDVYRSDCVTPLQTGCALTHERLGFLQDDTGENISAENLNYAELTGSFWVWKNYLKGHPEVEYVGFAHSRRFLDYKSKPKTWGVSFGSRKGFKNFTEGFGERYSESTIYPIVSGYDVIVPTKTVGGDTILKAYEKAGHPIDELELLVRIIDERQSDYTADVKEYLSGKAGYYCLNYLMRRDLYENFMSWLFPLLTELQHRSDWSRHQNYASQKVAAYLAERFFNVWLSHQKRIRNIKVLERDGVLLVPDDDVRWYDSLAYRLSQFRTAVRAMLDGSLVTHVRDRFRY